MKLESKERKAEIAKKSGKLNRVIILLDVLTDNKAVDGLSLFCMQTGYKLKDFIDFARLDERAKYCLKSQCEIKAAKALAAFYAKVRAWVADTRKSKEEFKEICDLLSLAFE